MFTVLNSQYRFNNKYLECVSDHMKDMRPFGDIPQKLGVQIKRSFVATRAFSQALQIATEVLKNMQQVLSNVKKIIKFKVRNIILDAFQNVNYQRQIH